MYETLAGAGISFPHFDLFRLLDRVHQRLPARHRVAFEPVLRGSYHPNDRRDHDGSACTIPTGLSFLDWLDDFLYLPETLYIIILIWLICSRPGRVSVDHRIARALGYQDG